MDTVTGTPPWLFLIIIGSYVVLSLFLGAMGVYFKPWVEPPEEKAAAPKAEG